MRLSADEKLPDMAFLEYLAELVEVNGEFIGPQDVNEKTIKQMNQENKVDVDNPKDKSKDEAKQPNEMNNNQKQEGK